jgi:hypothetical protein
MGIISSELVIDAAASFANVTMGLVTLAISESGQSCTWSSCITSVYIPGSLQESSAAGAAAFVT